MKIIKEVLKYILVFSLVVCIIIIGIIKIFSLTILNKEYVMMKFEEENFYQGIYELVEENFQHYIEQSGLDDSVLSDICSLEKVKQDIDLILSNIYNGASEEIDTTSIAEKLNSNIENNNIKNRENELAIQQYIEYICQEYNNTIIHTGYENQLNKLYINIEDKAERLTKICLAIIILDAICIILINNKEIFKNLHEIGIAMFSSGTFYIIVCKIINSKIEIQGIKMFNDVFSSMLVKIIQEVMNKIIFLGIGLVVIALICIIINAILVSINVAKDERKIKWKK